MLFEGFTKQTVAVTAGDIVLRRGGQGPPLLLLHGYPQTHVMWHAVAPRLAAHFTVVCPDLRGYGDSVKPPGGPRHEAYSKRAMAVDQVEVMQALGFQRFMAAGHDRGGRVLHRLLLDYPERVSRAAVLDIAPTLAMYERTDMTFATGYYHWFFLIQPFDLPERLIGSDPDGMIDWDLGSWGKSGEVFHAEAVAEYKRCFRDPATIHATCEDYRAAAGIDLDHDQADLARRITCPLLVLWGKRGLIEMCFDPLALWSERAENVSGKIIDCGHFLPEEAPEETARALLDFFRGAG